MFCKSVHDDSIRTVSIHIPPEGSDIYTNIVIPTTDAAPEVELYDSMIQPSKTWNIFIIIVWLDLQ